jgi:hypothetical protein
VQPRGNRSKMVDDDNSSAQIGGQMPQKARVRVEPACRPANANDRKPINGPSFPAGRADYQ